jgi:hypothetical protein
MLVLQVFYQDDDSGNLKVKTIANICYTYALALTALKAAQKQVKKDDPEFTSVSKLSFSQDYIHDFLYRNGLRRRRITAERELKRPAPKEIFEWQEEMRALIINKGVKHIINGDETGLYYCADPRDQYCAEDERRGVGLGGDKKKRVTGMLAGTSDGTMLPPFIILKTSSVKADMSQTTILHKSILEDELFRSKTSDDGEPTWEWNFWTSRGVHTLSGESEAKEHYFKFPFLRNRDTGAIATIQGNVRMDGPHFCMWLDLVVKPFLVQKLRNEPTLLILDSFKGHLTEMVKEKLKTPAFADRLRIEFMPVNMTDKLQVMDLVVNGPLKAHMRSVRTQALFDPFQVFLRNRKINSKLEWAPPIPTTSEGLDLTLQACSKVFGDGNFIAGVQKAFVKIGLVPDASGTYVNYASHETGGLAAYRGGNKNTAHNKYILGLEQPATGEGGVSQATPSDFVAGTTQWIDEWSTITRSDDGSMIHSV